MLNVWHIYFYNISNKYWYSLRQQITLLFIIIFVQQLKKNDIIHHISYKCIELPNLVSSKYLDFFLFDQEL